MCETLYKCLGQNRASRVLSLSTLKKNNIYMYIYIYISIYIYIYIHTHTHTDTYTHALTHLLVGHPELDLDYWLAVRDPCIPNEAHLLM